MQLPRRRHRPGDRAARCRDAAAADALEYERAARIRDRLVAVRKAVEKQTMVAERTEDLDVVAIAGDELEVAVQVFHVRRGRVMGRNGFVVDLAEDLGPGELVDRVLEGLYATEPAHGVPKLVLVPDEPAELRMHEEWLARQRGSYVEIRVPPRGDKRRRCWRPSSATPRRSSPATG